jgi:hypothetical protein
MNEEDIPKFKGQAHTIINNKSNLWPVPIFGDERRMDAIFNAGPIYKI